MKKKDELALMNLVADFLLVDFNPSKFTVMEDGKIVRAWNTYWYIIPDTFPELSIFKGWFKFRGYLLCILGDLT